MRALLRGERGEISLTQMLVATGVFVVILGATLTAFESFVKVDNTTLERNDSQDRARSSLDLLARELRNLASPTQYQPQAVDKAEPFDIVFQTVDAGGPNAGLNAANVRRVRYCLEAVGANGRLWSQSQTWTTQAAPAVPATSTCPAGGWASQRLVAEKIVNLHGGVSRPLFTFNASVATDISALHADLFIDPDPGSGPLETQLSTGVFLRNQNRRPTAAFTATTSAGALILNGSGSADPEGAQLSYVWYDGSTKIGTGIVYQYAVLAGTTHTITLKVYDPAALEGVAAGQAVTA